MKIQSAQYTDERCAIIRVICTDGTAQDVPVGSQSHSSATLAAWVAGGRTVASAPPKTEVPASERRAARYRTEADPLLLAALGYMIEKEAGGAVDEKLAKAKLDYLAAKARIRAEIP
jgi:hypothetical protein